ncbi:Uncharacterised protein [Serratia quinivorans]|nr:hypothetical protein [Serratia quinivorans]CAI2011577.1 Uncharacterised protein [Serratia quinivorans]
MVMVMVDKLKIFSLLMVGFVTLLFSSLGKATIYSTVTSASGSTANAIYEFSIDLWDDIGDSDPNPCYGTAECWLKVSHLHGANNNGGTSEPASQFGVRINEYSTIKDVRVAYQQAYAIPFNSSIVHVGMNSVNECVGLFYGSSLNNTSGDFLFPTSACGMVPSPIGKCEVTPNSIIIDHGTLSESDISGNVATNIINITCDDDMDVKLYSTEGSNGIDLDGGLISRLYINNTNLTEGVTVTGTPQGTIVNIESHLTAIDSVVSGVHSGSTTLIMTVI